jgi:hypothetical protein
MAFRIVTERDIRTPMLDNARLLNPTIYLGASKDQELINDIQCILDFWPGLSIRELIARTERPAPLARRHIWHLIRTRWLLADLTRPVDDKTVVRNVYADMEIPPEEACA